MSRFTFPDAELTTLALLRAVLPADVYLDRKVPATRRPKMVILRRQGGAPGRILDHPRIGVRVFAGSDKDANDLAALVTSHLIASDLKDLVVMGFSEVSDDGGQSLRYFTFDYTARGVVAA